MSAPPFIGQDYYDVLMAQYKKFLEDGIVKSIDLAFDKYGGTEATVKLIIPLRPTKVVEQDTPEQAYERAMRGVSTK